MPATETSKSYAEMADSLGAVAQDTGKQQMRLRVLRWLYKHKNEIPQALIDSLIAEVS